MSAREPARSAPSPGGGNRAPSVLARASETVTVTHGSTFMVASADGSVSGQHEHGLYSDDTRFVSGHEMRVNGRRPECLATARLSFGQARWTYAAPRLVTLDGRPIESSVIVTLGRSIGERRLHEDITVGCYGRDRVSLLLTLALECDFADIFEVRTERWQVRPHIATLWLPRERRLETRYRRDDFVRELVVSFQPDAAEVSYASGQLRFPVELEAGSEWRTCVQYDLVSDRRLRRRMEPCTASVAPPASASRVQERWQQVCARADAADPRLRTAFDQATDDLAALRLYDRGFSRDVWLPAAGIPWFVAVFGRDSIIASLQALVVHPLFAIGTLQKLAEWQAVDDDPARDAEPGKICHEMRVGEWSHFGTVPHSPYYGTADATPLYLLLLGEAYRWLGDAEALRPFRAAAERCLEWIDSHGDPDGDGLQEYAPRTPSGYRNHCWRDADDGVLDESGGYPPHPIGTVDLDACVYAAKRSVAGLFGGWGDVDRERSLPHEAALLRERYLAAYWLEDEGALAFARDGRKRALRTATSLPGHSLWTGILDDRRAASVVERLMRPDLYTGWGLRTLSSMHPSYDPYSYQRGSVWPHDTAIAAAGMMRHGHVEEAWRLVDGLLSAVVTLDRAQMPELFAGLPRSALDAPVPYARANVPQAWAAGSILHCTRTLLGLEPDVPAGRIHLDPHLPSWCPRLRLENVRIGSHRVTISAVRRRDGDCDVDVEGASGALEIVRAARHPS